MAFNTFNVGTRVRFSVTFASSGTPYDPSALTFQVTTAAGSDSGAITRDAAGAYHCDYLVRVAGLAIVTWTVSDAGYETVSTAEYTFQAPPSP